MNEKHNLSVDLKRISAWIMQGRDGLVDSILVKDMKMYKDLDVKIGRVELDKWLKMIKDRVGGKEQAAERALTASVILAG